MQLSRSVCHAPSSRPFFWAGRTLPENCVKRVRVAIIYLACLLQAPEAEAQADYASMAARLVNDAAMVLEMGSDATLVPDILLSLAALREASETDATGMAARAWFQAVDWIDIQGLRELLVRKVSTDEIRPDGPIGSQCMYEFSRRIDRLNGFTFTPWKRRGIPSIDSTLGNGFHFVLFGDQPLVRIVSWLDALPGVEPGTPLTPDMFETVGSGFATTFAFPSEDVAANVSLKTGDRIVGIVQDIANPDFGLGTLEIADYSYCLLPPTPRATHRR